MGICCSISRHALIFNRRQTQHSGSPTARTVVSAPHTEHFSGLLRRSGETDFFANSNRSAGTTGSGFVWILRFIGPRFHFTMTESTAGDNLTLAYPRTRPPPVSGLRRPLPGRIGSGGTSGRLRPWHIFLSDRSPRVRCGCILGNAPTRGGFDFGLRFSFSTPLQHIGRKLVATGCKKFCENS